MEQIHSPLQQKELEQLSISGLSNDDPMTG